MMSEKRKQTIKLCVALAILIFILVLVAIAMIKYEVEGETLMPFELTKIVVVSTAEGIENEENSKNWNFNICQNNDVYLYIDKNNEVNADENLLIKNVKMDNFQITEAPQKGSLKIYMPNSEEKRLYSYDEQFLVDEKLEYKGSSKSDSTTLEIGSKGGTALIRFCNYGIGNYTASKSKDKEIVHDGTWLKKLGISQELVKSQVTFDFTIETTKSKYQTNIAIDLPAGNLESGTGYLEITDLSNLIFKRVK